MKDNQGVMMTSQPIGGIVNIPANNGRSYLALVVTADTTVTISGGAPFVVLTDTVWAPIPSPINAIQFNGIATLILG